MRYGNSTLRARLWFKYLSDDQEPQTFIQVVSAFSLLDADQLGWDTSMKVYIPGLRQCFTSYKYQFDVDSFRTKLHKMHWAIEMPGKSEGADRELFITVEVLSDLSAQLCCGGATIVWVVVKHSELPRPIKVFKALIFDSL